MPPSRIWKRSRAYLTRICTRFDTRTATWSTPSRCASCGAAARRRRRRAQATTGAGDDEVTEHRWVATGDLPEPVHPPSRTVLALYEAYRSSGRFQAR